MQWTSLSLASHTEIAIGRLSSASCRVSWAALATASVLLNLSADNLNSTERYAYGTVPLLVALALVTGGRWWRPTVALCAVGLVGMTTLAWYGSYVP